MSRDILCSVGTSIITNLDGRPWAGRDRDAPTPSVEEMLPWVSTADPEKIGAETNTLRALEISEDDNLILVHSDTPAGRRCAEVLARYYEKRCRSVTLECVRQLGYGSEAFTRGLKGLVDIALRRAHESQEAGRTSVFCATGGFKAEIAFFNLIGALLGIEVVYMHELHRTVVRLPRLPLSWNADVVTANEAFFRWIDEEPRPSDKVEERLHNAPELRSLVEDDGDGHTFLTAAGDLLFKVARERREFEPRAHWPEAHALPPDQKNHVSGEEHHRPDGWRLFVRRLCEIDCVTSVRYDEAAYGGASVKVLDPATGAIAVRFGSRDTLPLRVETTARGQAQCDLVASYLRSRR